MAMEDRYKEVYYGDYCMTCKHWYRPEDDNPCHDCLNEPVNLYSHKPVYYECGSERRK